ncbi:hypothetical protein EVAR_75639_1 [Eumeta japonica]|uniref:Uncharacterized protein n=1 Tax=Eumeta variegata TaxID=151549 RepID=A0A4C1U0A5_EUMVA|nr:hypothetical protein EVAR_75639_1 [Eumeta japonica]
MSRKRCERLSPKKKGRRQTGGAAARHEKGAAILKLQSKEEQDSKLRTTLRSESKLALESEFEDGSGLESRAGPGPALIVETELKSRVELGSGSGLTEKKCYSVYNAITIFCDDFGSGHTERYTRQEVARTDERAAAGGGGGRPRAERAPGLITRRRARASR